LFSGANLLSFAPNNQIFSKMPKRILLTCGIVSFLYYAALNIFIPMWYEGYNSASQTISELSAIGAPTRTLWIVAGLFYALLVVAFGMGVRRSAGQNHRLRIVGTVMIINAVIGVFWPPMHQREVLAAGGGTLTDTLHIVFTFITVPLFLLATGFGAATFGKGFRVYSIITIVTVILFGILTGLDSPRMEANLSTPWIGVWERISIGAYMLWVAILAIVLLHKEKMKNSLEAAAKSEPNGKLSDNGNQPVLKQTM
jgi:hypothetical protein